MTALWTPAETKILKDLFAKKKSYKEIGQAVGRTEGAVERRVQRLKQSGDPFFKSKELPGKHGFVERPAVIKPSAGKKLVETPATSTERQKKYQDEKETRARTKEQQRKATDPFLHKIVTMEPDVAQALQEVSEALETVFEAMKNHRLSKRQLQITLAAINLQEALELELESRGMK